MSSTSDIFNQTIGRNADKVGNDPNFDKLFPYIDQAFQQCMQDSPNINSTIHAWIDDEGQVHCEVTDG